MDLKPWRCDGGHILGYVKRSARGVRQLLLLRHATDMESEMPEEVDVIGRLVDQSVMLDIRCDVCGAVRPWQKVTPEKKEAVRYVAE
jgi:hypothetical protein